MCYIMQGISAKELGDEMVVGQFNLIVPSLPCMKRYTKIFSSILFLKLIGFIYYITVVLIVTDMEHYSNNGTS